MSLKKELSYPAWYNIFSWLTYIISAAVIYMVIIWVPRDVRLGDVQRIFYFHVASAWVAFFAFFIVFATSILYLKTRSRSLDRIAFSSAEVGVVFTTIVLITGPIWAKSSWNVWWNWDVRLTTTLILWFIYLAYLMVRGTALEEEKKRVLSAVFGIVGFLNVPLVFMSIRWWWSIHPTVVDSGGFHMGPNMFRTLMASLLTFTLLYVFFLVRGIYLRLAAEKLEELKDLIRE
ncbi:MAG: cytochrome c biogenesis protein CcsA [Dethiobacter sp.]|jgi:heme exporter protein C|nr:cytochrome c biogenesis protein CcsA [Dethiobacter sp.]